MAVPTAPDPSVELRVVAPAGLVEAARRKAGPNVSTAEIVRQALAAMVGVNLDDFPKRRRGRPPRKVSA